MRRSVKIALFATPVALATLAGGFAPMVRAKAEAKAEARGATLTVGSVRPGAGRVWLRDVVVHFADIPALETHLDAIEVNVTPEQVEDRIDDALQLYALHHYDAATKTYFKHLLTADEADLLRLRLFESADF